MLTRRIFLIALAALLCLPAAAPAGQKKGKPFAQWWEDPGITKQLHLSPQDKKQLEKLNLEMRRELQKQQNIIDESRLNLEELFAREPLDSKAVDRQYNRIAKAQTARGMARSRFLVEVRQILGRDRFQQLKTIFDNMK